MTALKDLHQIIAEIAMAFAGFSGVVAAFSTFRVSTEAISLRVRLLVTVALSVLVGSILPFVLIAFGTAESTAIRLSALVIDICIITICVWAWRGLLPLYRAGVLKTQVITTAITAVAAAAIVASSVVAAGGLAPLAASLYLGVLFFGIILCCYYFILLMFAIDIGKRS